MSTKMRRELLSWSGNRHLSKTSEMRALAYRISLVQSHIADRSGSILFWRMSRRSIPSVGNETQAWLERVFEFGFQLLHTRVFRTFGADGILMNG
jgi:hypothetical protein